MIDIKKYDKNNIFSKILKKEIPSDAIYEDKYIYAFKDINPQAPVHALIIPKQEFCSLNDFCSEANHETLNSMIRSIPKIAKILKLSDGYRIISNIGNLGGQEIPHFHIHLLGGEMLGRIR